MQEEPGKITSSANENHLRIRDIPSVMVALALRPPDDAASGRIETRECHRSARQERDQAGTRWFP